MEKKEVDAGKIFIVFNVQIHLYLNFGDDSGEWLDDFRTETRLEIFW